MAGRPTPDATVSMCATRPSPILREAICKRLKLLDEDSFEVCNSPSCSTDGRDACLSLARPLFSYTLFSPARLLSSSFTKVSITFFFSAWKGTL